MPDVLDKIEHELNWLRLTLDIWDPKTPKWLGCELQMRVRAMKRLIDLGRLGPPITSSYGRSPHDN